MTEHEALVLLEQRIAHALRTESPRVIRSDWMSRRGLRYWLGYLRHDPAEFAYTVPRRLACRLLRRHNPTCIGRRTHSRAW